MDQNTIRSLVALLKYGGGIDVTGATPTGPRPPAGPFKEGTREHYQGTRYGLPWSGQAHAADAAAGMGDSVMAGIGERGGGVAGPVQLPGEQADMARRVIEALRGKK